MSELEFLHVWQQAQNRLNQFDTQIQEIFQSS